MPLPVSVLYGPVMSQFGHFLWTSPQTYRAVLLDALLMFAVILIAAAVINDEGWRGGLTFGAVLAGVRLVIFSLLVWNNRAEPR